MSAHVVTLGNAQCNHRSLQNVVDSKSSQEACTYDLARMTTAGEGLDLYEDLLVGTSGEGEGHFRAEAEEVIPTAMPT